MGPALTLLPKAVHLINIERRWYGTPDQLMKLDGYFRDMMFGADGPLTGSV
jgi:hypothetical protein